MQDRLRPWEKRFAKLANQGLMVSTDVFGQSGNSGRTARGIVYQHGDSGSSGCWHHGGLINEPKLAHSSFRHVSIPRRRAQDAPSDDQVNQENQDSHAQEGIPPWDRAVSAGQGSMSSGAQSFEVLHQSNISEPIANIRRESETPWELIPLRDVVSCVPPLNPSSSRFELHVIQRYPSPHVIRLELDARTQAMRKSWVAAIVQGIQKQTVQILEETFSGASPNFNSHDHKGPKVSVLTEWARWFQFPVKFLLRVTVPDVRDVAWRKYFVMSFLMSMFWLALFSYLVVQVCGILHAEFGISTKLLGFTIAAIGTSFPNVISCSAVSRQGKTPMAIANALGANIQNVFVALALPWTLKTLYSGDFRISSGNLVAAVVAMLVTLALAILVVLAAGCTLPRCTGYTFLLLYALYFVFSIGQEITNCDSWPFQC
jgi:Ca2+/Na+ antiporter